MDDTRWTWLELACTVALPTLVLWSGGSVLGSGGALVLALAFPLGFAVVSMVRQGRPSALSVFSLVGIGITGAVGLLALDPRWFALKEGALPMLFGAGIAASGLTRASAVSVVLDKVLDPDKTAAALTRSGAADRYARIARRATFVLGATTAASGLVSFALARWWVVAPSGSEAFNTQLGSYNLWSFAIVSLPAIVASVFVLQRALLEIEAALGEPLDGLLRSPTRSSG